MPGIDQIIIETIQSGGEDLAQIVEQVIQLVFHAWLLVVNFARQPEPLDDAARLCSTLREFALGARHFAIAKDTDDLAVELEDRPALRLGWVLSKDWLDRQLGDFRAQRGRLKAFIFQAL